MDQDIDYQKAMQMVNIELQHMKTEIDEVDAMRLSGGKKKLAKYMKRIYKKLEETVNSYIKTEKHSDFNNIWRELEALKPAFILNYNEICYEQGLDQLNDALDEMEEELKKIDAMKLSGAKGERAKEMHEIYDQIYHKVDRYAYSHDHQDFETAVHEVERLKPDFLLSYNELTD